MALRRAATRALRLPALLNRSQWIGAAATASAASTSIQAHLSSTADDADASAEALQEQLEDAALARVRELGWSAALPAAALDLGLSPAATGLLPLGPASLVLRLLRRHNAALAAELGGAAGAARLAALPSGRARLAAALRLRLEMTVPWIDQWPAALALLAAPRAAPAAVQLLAELVDEVVYSVEAAGERAAAHQRPVSAAAERAGSASNHAVGTDAHASGGAGSSSTSGSSSASSSSGGGSSSSSAGAHTGDAVAAVASTAAPDPTLRFYSRRAGVAAIYAATELHMLTDFSPGFEDTWALLDRQLHDAQRVSEALDRAGAAAGSLLQSLLRPPGPAASSTWSGAQGT